MARKGEAEPASQGPAPALAGIADAVRACRRCGLCELRGNAVPGEGTGQSGVMLVGEAPGRNEDETGRPFCGAAGKKLDLALAAAGLDRTACFVTSIVKCRPPGNRDPTEAEKAACRPHLVAQIEALRPRVIVALGRHGLSGLIGHVPADFSHLAGSFVAGPRGIPVFVSLHPAAVIYRARWMDDYVAHWQAFGAWLRSGNPAPLVPAPAPPRRSVP